MKLANQTVSTAFYTDLGWMATTWRGRLLARIAFGQSTRKAALDTLAMRIHKDRGIASRTSTPVEELSREQAKLVDQLIAFADGTPQVFHHVPIEFSDRTEFQSAILVACREIPWGATCSYGELAQRAGYPGAARAVGNVMANNPCPIVIPCHRVIASGQRCGGFTAPGGIDLKRRMLALEAESELWAVR